MADSFANVSESIDAPASNGSSITPSASPLANVTRAIYVGIDGDLTVTLLGGQTVTLSSVKAGGVYPIRATHVLSATSAGGLVGLW